jgi:hypothetical protein
MRNARSIGEKRNEKYAEKRNESYSEKKLLWSNIGETEENCEKPQSMTRPPGPNLKLWPSNMRKTSWTHYHDGRLQTDHPDETRRRVDLHYVASHRLQRCVPLEHIE